MKVWLVSEYEFHELLDIQVFSSEIKAKEFVQKRIEENDNLENEEAPARYQHNICISHNIEEKEVI